MNNKWLPQQGKTFTVFNYSIKKLMDVLIFLESSLTWNSGNCPATTQVAMTPGQGISVGTRPSETSLTIKTLS